MICVIERPRRSLYRRARATICASVAPSIRLNPDARASAAPFADANATAACSVKIRRVEPSGA